MNNYIGGEGRKAFDPASPEFALARPKPSSNVLDQIATKPALEQTYERMRGLASTYELPSFSRFSRAYEHARPRRRDHPTVPVAMDVETYGMDFGRGSDRTGFAVLDSLGQISRYDFARAEHRVSMHVANNFGVQADAAAQAMERFTEVIRAAMPRIRDGLMRTMESLFMYGVDDPNRRFHTVTGRMSSAMPERQTIISTPRNSRRDRFLFNPGPNAMIRFLDTEQQADGLHWVRSDDAAWARTMNFGGFPEPDAMPTFMVKGSDHNQAEVDLMAEILRELGADVPEGITGITSEHIHAAGLTRILFEEKFQFRRKMVALVPVRILRRARRTVAGIAVVEAENRFGERILAPAPTGSQ